MSDGLFDQNDDAATPIGPEDRAQLKLTFVTTRAELNAAEQEAIERRRLGPGAFSRGRRRSMRYS